MPPPLAPAPRPQPCRLSPTIALPYDFLLCELDSTGLCLARSHQTTEASRCANTADAPNQSAC